MKETYKMGNEYPTLVLQSFGRENEYKRALLTIFSYYAHTSLPLIEARVLLFTDNPDYFSSFVAGLPVEYILLTPEKIKIMRGEIDFLHRMKIALIEEAFEKTNGSILYADSDTFFISDPNPLLQRVSESTSFMHLLEYKFGKVRNLPLPSGKTVRDFVALIEVQKFKLADSSEISITSEHASWNAGVMMFDKTHARFIPDIYALTDQFFPPTHNHASEQYAFSVILQTRTNLSACESINYHYWYRIKKQIVDDFLNKQLNINWAEQSLHEKLHAVSKWTNMLPGYFEKHLWTIKDKAIQNFNEKNFFEAYKWSAKALLMDFPGDKKFIKDISYHTKSLLLRKGS